MKIVTVTRFDDSDHDAGYDYRGFNYVIQKEEDVFLIRTYDDEPGKATVISSNGHVLERQTPRAR